MRITTILLLILLKFTTASAQPADGLPLDLSMEKILDAIQLTPGEVPARYKAGDEHLFNSVEAYTFYNQSSNYYDSIGSTAISTYQAYQSGTEKGIIYYFAFRKDFVNEGFLRRYFWHGPKPTKEHPEEFFIKGKILVIWSFVGKSEIKEISKRKVTSILK